MAYRRAGPIAAIIALGTTFAFYYGRPATPSDPKTDESLINPFKTTGVANIEKAYTNAGAGPNHTPAYGGTKMGDKEDVSLKDGSASGKMGGRGQQPFKQQDIGDDQRTWPETKAGEVFDEAMVGSKKGK